VAQPLDPLHRKVSQRLKALMAEKGLSTNRLADFSGVGRGRLSEILRAQSSPTLRTLARLAAALEVPVRELLPESDE
jgi:transcriptional regulator with XRE-family HTH domain